MKKVSIPPQLVLEIEVNDPVYISYKDKESSRDPLEQKQEVLQYRKEEREVIHPNKWFKRPYSYNWKVLTKLLKDLPSAAFYACHR